ncbi:MAG: zinc metalloprotease [Pseudonocardiaceae bacterium]|nr:zinc metalloprotease [Pseudonocardiaceae bacterium]
MSFALGVVLFAVGIGVSIALHEAGHMYSAKLFGMRVRRYFIGFGPTLFSFRRGETEYGLKAIPAGGFCDIAGMTALDELPDPMDRKRAFFRYTTWKRVVVLSAGSLTHFVLGIMIIYVMALSTGLPNLNAPPPEPPPATVAQVSECVGATTGACSPEDPAPAREAGLRTDDRIVAVAGTPVNNIRELQGATRPLQGPTEFVIERNGQQQPVLIDVARVPASALGGPSDEMIGAIGIATPLQAPTAVPMLQYGPLDAVPGTFAFTGTLFANTWEGIKQLPQKIEPLLAAISGEPRSPETPVSVVGASILGGDAVDIEVWWFFLYLLAALNLFVGVFNLLPLLPLDGGHIAVNVYERARNGLRAMRGRPAGPPVDYTKLLPLTYAFALVFIAFAALTLTADIVNPLRFSP